MENPSTRDHVPVKTQESKSSGASHSSKNPTFIILVSKCIYVHDEFVITPKKNTVEYYCTKIAEFCRPPVEQPTLRSLHPSVQIPNHQWAYDPWRGYTAKAPLRGPRPVLDAFFCRPGKLGLDIFAPNEFLDPNF